ncbi:MAG: helix-turn-helix transcriptional regulator [Tetrasphaera sp.]|nr:helix-turn-helix transcriptional regulator [Tetrasphaera sp.]
MTTPALRRLRHVDVDPTASVATWPFEALVAVLERGSIRDWAVLSAEIGRDPWGPVARQVEEYTRQENVPGLGALLNRAIARARRRAEEAERAAVAARVSELVRESGLSTAEFAERIGTSRSRLSTYRHGRVTPSAALMHRMEHVAAGDSHGCRTQ